MSAVKQEEVLITFDELQQLENADIAACIDKYSALSICEKSSAPPSKIYNLWVQKLMKAYNLQEFSIKDWRRIIEYLGNVLQDFVKKVYVSNDSSQNELDQWWSDTLELLRWLQPIINTLDISIICLLFTFALEIIIRTCKFANKSNFKVLCNIQQLIINLTNNSLFKLTNTDDNDLIIFNTMLTSLCDVGSFLSSGDIKTSLETWRTIVKLSEKLHNLNTQLSIIKTESSTDMERNWNKKAILGIFKELNKILHLYRRNSGTSNNNSLLQIAQFYLKLLKLIITYSKENLKTFPAIKEFIEIYDICEHGNMVKQKIDLVINKDLLDVFSLIYRDSELLKLLLQHLKYDADSFECCNLVLDYLKVNIESCSENRLNVKPDVEELLKVYNCLVEGPLIFIDSDKYTQILKDFVGLTLLDSTNIMHKKFCEYVMDSPWIRAYTSMEILTIYYSIVLNQSEGDMNLKSLEFWLKMWNKSNNSNYKYRQGKQLIEVLLKTILHKTPDAKLQQLPNNKFENIEIVLLMCGKQTEQGLQYLHTNLVQNLNKMQQRRITGKVYKELINFLDICILKPQIINNFEKENIFVTFIGLLTLQTTELQRFHEFVNKCLCFFSLQQDKQQNDKIITYLMDHEQQCCDIQNVFLLEFLLKQRPQSNKLLQELETSQKLTSYVANLIDCPTTSNKTIDLKIFKALGQTFQQSNNPYNDVEQIKKKPRLDKGNFSDIKFILNDLNLNSQKLLNFPPTIFDAKDIELMQAIKNNIEKCLVD